MTAPQQVQQHPASVDAYINHGWSIVPIPPGTKGPDSKAWNRRENALTGQADLPKGYGIGLAHAYSGTMALDIDDWVAADKLLSAHGVHLDLLYKAPDAVIIDSGRAGRGKLLYAMPEGATLPTKKIQSEGKTAYELRCATANGLTVQDVLPPTIHPDTNQPYRWAGNGHWGRLPVIPEQLLALWQSMVDKDNTRIEGCGPVGTTWAEIKDALSAIDPNCSRKEWLDCGMALQWAATQMAEEHTGLLVWNEWSSAAGPNKYKGPADLVAQWGSFKADKRSVIKLGTLFKMAKDAGWVRPPIDVSALFRKINPSVTIDSKLGCVPKSPEVDPDHFPPVLRDRARELNISSGCDVCIPLWAGVAAVCAAVDSRTRLELMDGFVVPPILWMMVIGPPGTMKSPGSKPMLAVLKDLEKEDLPRHAKALMHWEGLAAVHEAAKTTMHSWLKSPEGMLSEMDQAPHVPELPPMPERVRISTSDVTSQKLVRMCAARPQGILCHLDEMLTWMESVTSRNSGENRSVWPQGYEGSSYTLDRVGDGTIQADCFAVSVYGNVQPAVLEEARKRMTGDGLLQRFLPVKIDAGIGVLGEPIPTWMTSQSTWEAAIRHIASLPPTTYKLSQDAYILYRSFQAWLIQKTDDERLLQAGDAYLDALAKMTGTLGRIALIFHVTEASASPVVSGELMERCIRFVRNFVIPSTKHVFGDVDGTTVFDAWMRDWVMQHCDAGVVTLLDIKHSGRRQLEGTTPWQSTSRVINAMGILEAMGWVIRLDDGSAEFRHSAEWALNPDLGSVPGNNRQHILDAKQRIIDEIQFGLHGREIGRTFVYGHECYGKDGLARRQALIDAQLENDE